MRRAVVRGVEVTFLVRDALFATNEASAWEQLDAALPLPGLERVIVTPDVHTGYAVPIGFTAVSRSHRNPDTVGPDPACALSLSLLEAARDVLAAHLGVPEGRFVGHIPHNFIERWNGAYGQRKGATPAYDHQGIRLMIPGTVATTPYLLEPGPNAERLGPSVPHGTGRVLTALLVLKGA